MLVLINLKSMLHSSDISLKQKYRFMKYFHEARHNVFACEIVTCTVNIYTNKSNG